MIEASRSLKQNAGRLTFAAVSFLTVAGHYFIYSQTQREIKDTVRSATQEQIDPVKEAINNSQFVREREFVRRPDLEKIIVRIDTLNEQIGNMREQVAKLEGFLKGRERQRSEIFWGKR